MADLQTIKAPIKAEMDEFQPFFRNFLRSGTRLLDLLLFYVQKQKGKQIRPMLVFLTAKLYGTVNEHTYHAAALIELMHTASLVHDDVVDESDKRRGFWSVNAIWLEIVSRAFEEMSEGELLQIDKARHLNIDNQTYFDVIRKKTAALMIACTTAGACSVGAAEADVERMERLGEYIGIAFQIRDDLFDYEVNGIFGKPAGNDLRERKITLPLIHALQNSTPSERRQMIKILRQKVKTDADIDTLMNFVRGHGGIEHAQTVMAEYVEKAKVVLAETPDNAARQSLIDLIDYTISRKK